MTKLEPLAADKDESLSNSDIVEVREGVFEELIDVEKGVRRSRR